MITYWANAEGRWGVEEYLARRAPDLRELIVVREYEELAPEVEVTGGAHIFSALDQLSDTGRELVASLHDRIRQQWPAVRLLNDPRRACRRFELLTRMHQAGINPHRVRRASDECTRARFPVFVREESGHGGSLTALLHGPADLRRALTALRARGHRARDLLVVEYEDLADAEGRFRAASAYRIGDQIVPAHVLLGTKWVLKWTDSEHDERAMRAYLEYVSSTAHEAWLRKAFALAEVEFGRMDYGIRGDTLRVWEINLNPTMGPSRGPEPPPYGEPMDTLLAEARATYHANMRRAFRALDPDREQARATVALDPRLLATVRAESARDARRAGARRFLTRLYEHPALGGVFRAVYRRLLPRR